MIKNKFFGCIIAGVLLISGCAERVTVNPDSNLIQENLLVRCTDDTPIPESTKVDDKGRKVYDGVDLSSTLKEWQKIYNICASEHDKLVESVREMQKERTIKIK